MNPAAHTDLQLDALREVANVGGGHAASALAALVGGPVHIGLPSVARGSPASTALKDVEPPRLVVHLSMEGDLAGAILVSLTEEDAARLCAAVAGKGTPPAELDAYAKSAVGEVANILASACLNAIGSLTGLTLLPTAPSIVTGPPMRVVDQSARSGDAPLVLQTSFTAGSAPPFRGQLWLVPDEASVTRLLSRLGL